MTNTKNKKKQKDDETFKMVKKIIIAEVKKNPKIEMLHECVYLPNNKFRTQKCLMIKQNGVECNLYNLPHGFMIKGSLDLRNKNLTELPDLTHITVEEDFDCSENKLTSLKGCPQVVGGSFYCSENKLVTLEGCPQKVGRDFDCSHNKLTSLAGAPQSVGKCFNCSNNKLTSLTGAPKEIGINLMYEAHVFHNGRYEYNKIETFDPDMPICMQWRDDWADFDCSYNKLTSLKGAPQHVGGNFNCCKNQLVSLEDAPKTIGGSLDCSWNKLETLRGCPQTINGSFSCAGNKLKNFDGAPLSVAGIFDCNTNKLTSLKGIPIIYSGWINCLFNPIKTFDDATNQITKGNKQCP